MTLRIRLLLIPFFVMCLLVISAQEYGVDVSFPMTRSHIEETSILGNRQAIYEQVMEGCTRRYSEEQCQRSEQNRIQRNIHRPYLMKNFTAVDEEKNSNEENL